MQLWLVVLRETETYTDQASALFPQLVRVFNRDFDNLGVGMNLIDVYAVVGGMDFMRVHGEYMEENGYTEKGG